VPVGIVDGPEVELFEPGVLLEYEQLVVLSTYPAELPDAPMDDKVTLADEYSIYEPWKVTEALGGEPKGSFDVNSTEQVTVKSARPPALVPVAFFPTPMPLPQVVGYVAGPITPEYFA
jgi:hypothetical protein